MGLISELDSMSPAALLRENLELLWTLLKKYTQEQGGLNHETCMQIVPGICKHLQIGILDWNWLTTAPENPIKVLQLEIAVACLESGVDDELLLKLMHVISLYINEHVPWSNSRLAGISMALNKQCCGSNLVKFADLLKPCFLSISGQKFTTILSKRNGVLRFTKTRVSRPALGLQIPSTTEDNERTQWKLSDNITTLSSVVLLMACDTTSQYSSACSSFILNVLDDPDPLFRAQGCFLLQHLLALGHGQSVSRAGLVAVFEESVKTCLTYLPQLTPSPVSLRLLKDGAYPALFSLLQLSKDTNYVTYLEILDGNLLAAISHVLGRNSDATTNILLAFFFSQISLLIQKNLRLLVLACFSRLNYVVCQTISNPYLIESDNGSKVVEAALDVQRDFLNMAFAQKDLLVNELVLQYKLDFLAAWTVLTKRVVKYGVGSSAIKTLIHENITILRKIAEFSGLEDLEADIRAISFKAPEVLELF